MIKEDEDLFWAEMAGVRPLDRTHTPVHTPVSRQKLRVMIRPRAPDFGHLGRRGPTEDARQVDQNTATRLRRGKMSIEGRLDLHGDTLAVAQENFKNFIVRSAAAGKRCVLVVTGKGDPMDLGDPVTGRRPRGAIRRALPDWAALHPLNHLILQVVPAQAEHGGAGAFYLLLRRINKT